MTNQRVILFTTVLLVIGNSLFAQLGIGVARDTNKSNIAWKVYKDTNVRDAAIKAANALKSEGYKEAVQGCQLFNNVKSGFYVVIQLDYDIDQPNRKVICLGVSESSYEDAVDKARKAAFQNSGHWGTGFKHKELQRAKF